MQDVTKQYLEASEMFACSLNSINATLDGVVKMLSKDGVISDSDAKDLAKLKQAFGDELGIVIEKAGLAMEKMVSHEVIQAAVAWHMSDAARALREIRPKLAAYVQSLDEEYARRIQLRMAEISALEAMKP